MATIKWDDSPEQWKNPFGVVRAAKARVFAAGNHVGSAMIYRTEHGARLFYNAREIGGLYQDEDAAKAALEALVQGMQAHAVPPDGAEEKDDGQPAEV